MNEDYTNNLKRHLPVTDLLGLCVEAANKALYFINEGFPEEALDKCDEALGYADQAYYRQKKELK